ncbi:hypothetical protein [Staphylococcus warneri]|uniref:hypothetical protein n=1 Tax=Staphylococcus warneri TaxID=1292 RepID=UPI003BA1BFD0
MSETLDIKKGTTYWGYIGKRETRRKVNMIETRSSGNRYVNWTTIKKDGSEGQTGWARLDKFREWVKGVYEYG